MPFEIDFAFKEPATTAENCVVADVTEVVSQVIHAVQTAVTIPASEICDHLAGEWMGEASNVWLVGVE